jgi:filamentous hemagglutinin family protein
MATLLSIRLRETWEHARQGRRLAQAATGFGALAPLMALANPTGGQVVGGQATISNPSANGTVIKQASQNAAINWQQFSVGANQYVQFIQPDSSAVVLNRVIGGNVSSIFGSIKANGQVFLVNPNGILFGPGASLDVSGLVASTQDIGIADFMAGHYAFTKGTGAPDASVINQGVINANGGYVVLAGDYVENDGVINAQSGRVLLAAGGGTTLTLDKSQGLISYSIDSATLARLAGVDNAGSITADGGTVVMTADVANALTATAVNNTGFVAAHSITSRDGVIILRALGGDIDNSGTLDASATDSGVAGGVITIRGDGHTQIEPTSVITTEGDGAKGGFVELSGHTLHVAGLVDPGKGGSLLIDPAIINITSTSTTPAVVAATTTVGAGYIANVIQGGVTVALVASTAISYSGAARSLSDVNPAGGNLSMRIGTLTAVSGSLGGAHCVSAGVCSGGAGTNRFTPSGFGTINLTGLTINITGAFTASASHGVVTLDTVQAGAVTISGRGITLNGNVTAAGRLSITAHNAPVTPPAATITVAIGKVLSAKSMSLTASGSYGGVITLGAVNANGGSMFIRAADTGSVSGSGAIKAGNLTGKDVTLSVSAVGTPAAKLNVGSVTAEHLLMSLSGKTKTVVTGPLTANNPSGAAFITITENAPPVGGTGTITVNGNITVSGTPPATNASLKPFDGPLAAGLAINDAGSGSATRTVKVNGTIKVTAVGAAFAASSGNEGGVIHRRKQSGTGGVAGTFILAGGSHGAASVTGSISARGPDAHVGVEAHGVTVGNITVTGSGHTISRTIVANTTISGAHGGTYSSHNSAGQATVGLGNLSGATVSGVTVKAGNITVSGKGVAEAGLFASNVSAGNISVTATAAKGTLKQSGLVFSTAVPCVGSNCNSAAFYRGIGHVALHSGSITGGRAVIGIQANHNGVGSSGAPAVSIKVGSLGATGVGLAAIRLDATTIQTQALSAVATKGTMVGKGSSTIGLTAPTRFAHSFNLNGGAADIKLHSGNSSGSKHSFLTQGGGPVTVGGSITASGPVVGVEIKGKTLKVSGNIAVTGSGGALTSDTVVTPPTGTGYHTHFVGPGEPTHVQLAGGSGGSVSVAGNIGIKAPGLVGLLVTGANLKLHGLTGSASAAGNYSILDTRVSTLTTSFADGSLAVFVDDVAKGPVFTSASVNGGVTLAAKGNVDLASRIKVSGGLSVQAGGNIVGNAGSAVTHINSIIQAMPRAGNNSTGGPLASSLPNFALQASSAKFVAGGSIDLAPAVLTIGNGKVAGVTSDAGLLAALAAIKAAPGSVVPSGYFKAGTSLSLGAITMTGDYLYLQGDAVSIAGPVSLPAKSVIQVSPSSATLPIDIEDTTIAASALRTFAVTPTLFGLTNLTFLSLFPGDTIVVGNSGELGNVEMGVNGKITLAAGTNLVIDTLGSVKGLSTVITTGTVLSLAPLIGLPPVTAGEIDPSSGTGLGDQTDKKKLAQTGGDTSGGQQGGTISSDSNPSDVCH